MARAPDHPSGAKHTISLSLTPETVELLDGMVAARGTNRSQFVSRLIERVWAGGAIKASAAPPPSNRTPQSPGDRPVRSRNVAPEPSGCAHVKRTVKGGGIVYCDGCGAMRGPSGKWSAL